MFPYAIAFYPLVVEPQFSLYSFVVSWFLVLTCKHQSSISFAWEIKPVTDEQVFYVTSFYVTSFLWQVFMWQVLFAKCTCVYATNFIWQVFIWQVLFACVNVSEKGVYRRHDRKIIIVRWPITSNAQITLTSFLCWPIQTNKICTLTFFLWQVHLFKS
jgi:hypothetical protein